MITINQTKIDPAKQYALSPWNVRPYRLAVFGTREMTVGKGKRQRTKTVGYGLIGWTPIQFFDAGARLPGAGSFAFPGFIRAMKAARAYLAEPEVDQVQIRTEQDRTVLIYNKWADGRITFYRADED